MDDLSSTQKELNDFVTAIRKSLNEADLALALTTINEAKLKPHLQSSTSDIIPLITAHLSEDVLNEKPALFECSVQVLDAIAQDFEAEEVLLQLIEDVGKAGDDTKFLLLLKPLQKVLLRVPKKRLNSLGWGLNAVQSYLNELPLPENANLEDDEEILMDADPLTEKISGLYVQLLPFYDGLIDSVEGDEAKDRQVVLLKFLLQLLGKPLALMDLKRSAKSKSRGRRVAEALVEKILRVAPDIYWFLELQTAKPPYDIGQIDDLSLATLFYLVLAEQVLLEKVPKVYDHTYVFQYALHLMTELFKYDNQFVIHNGLKLSRVLLNNVAGSVFGYALLDSGHHSKFCKGLTNVIVYNPLESYRQQALQVFQRYLFQFETRGRFLLVYNLMKVMNHTGIIGYIITQYKDMLIEEFNNDQPGVFAYFSDQKLFVLLNAFCHLHKGEESDLVELADQIVATLNLLRYLAIRDKTNLTKVWDHFKVLEKSYLEPLKRGLRLSRAHYELKIKELKTESGEGDTGDSKISVTVAGQQLTELPTNEKLKVLYSSLTSFDVIESLLSRLNELIEMGLTSCR